MKIKTGLFLPCIYITKGACMNTTALDQLLTSGQGHLYYQALCACHQKDRPHYFYAVACTKEAVFDLASISKIITTTFIIQLIGQKRLSLYFAGPCYRIGFRA